MSDYNLKGDYKINAYIIEKNESPFAGVGVAVVTPFDEDNKIDKQAIYRISEVYIGKVSIWVHLTIN